jgi:hypothetical protein
MSKRAEIIPVSRLPSVRGISVLAAPASLHTTPAPAGDTISLSEVISALSFALDLT